MNSQKVFTIKKWIIVVLASISFILSCLLLGFTIHGYKVYTESMDTFYRKHLGDSLSSQPKEVNLMKIAIIFSATLSGLKAIVSILGAIGAYRENFRLLLVYLSEKVLFSLALLAIIIWRQAWKLLFIPILPAISCAFDLFFLKELYLRKQSLKMNLENNENESRDCED